MVWLCRQLYEFHPHGKTIQGKSWSWSTTHTLVIQKGILTFLVIEVLLRDSIKMIGGTYANSAWIL